MTKSTDLLGSGRAAADARTNSAEPVPSFVLRRSRVRRRASRRNTYAHCLAVSTGNDAGGTSQVGLLEVPGGQSCRTATRAAARAMGCSPPTKTERQHRYTISASHGELSRGMDRTVFHRDSRSRRATSRPSACSLSRAERVFACASVSATGLTSQPIAFRPSRCATSVVVPLPFIGSRTTSPLLENSETRSPTEASEKPA